MYNTLKKFDGIFLEEMNQVRLMNRQDTKLILKFNELESVLEAVANDYFVLEIKGKRLHGYNSLYYDTKNLDAYQEHHNGKLNRYKFRYRSYLGSDLHFFEIKYKNNKRRTVKKRMETFGIEQSMGRVSKAFLSEKTLVDPETLHPSLWINFDRITLVHRNFSERVTIDMNLGFKPFDKDELVEHPEMVIVEVKQKRFDRLSPMIETLHQHQVYPIRISKYCLGVLSTFSGIKRNAFKPKLIRISKIIGNDYYRTLTAS
ncbi:MAG: polyphosphate polymerase domain-containing protein [Bacteroidota bacterium]